MAVVKLPDGSRREVPDDSSAMQVPVGLNPDTDLGLILYDVFDLDVAFADK